MRARKLAAVAPEERSPPEEVADRWPADEELAAHSSEDAGPIALLCIDCGTDGCREHGETARLEAPSRAVHDAVARLQRAAAEHRVAARALRALVLSEVARGRGDLETKPPPQAEPCPQCAIRDAEAAAAPAAVTKAARRRAKGDDGQQALPFKVS
jgi:hypothetical protein